MTKLSYGYNAPELKENQFKISPSGAFDFFGFTASWFEQQFLGQNKFLGSNASVRGTVLHWYAECYAKNNQIGLDDIHEADRYIEEQCADRDIEVTEHGVRNDFDNMWTMLSSWINANPLESTEEYISYELTPNVVLSGQVDYKRRNNEAIYTEDGIIINPGSLIVGDYKSTGSKNMPKSPSYEHWFQAEIYATIEALKGNVVDAVEITYVKAYVPGEVSVKTGRTGKSYPTEVKSFTRPFTKEDFEKKKGQMENIADCMEYFFKNPDLANILFKDGRLKGKNIDVFKYSVETDELF